MVTAVCQTTMIAALLFGLSYCLVSAVEMAVAAVSSEAADAEAMTIVAETAVSG